MNKQHCLLFLYALFLCPFSIESVTAAQLVQTQLLEPESQKQAKRNKIKKKERAEFEHAYCLTKKDAELFNQSFEQAPAKLKAIVNEMIQKTDTASKFKTLLLSGPSGSGKTILAQAIAHKLGRNCEVVRATTLLGHFRDQAAEAVRDLFKRMRKDPKKPALVLDEVNALTDDHTSEHSDTKHTAMQLWTCLDKYSKKKGFLLIGTTNVTKKMHHQLQSRFQGKTFVIDLPLYEARKKALELHLKQIKLNDDCNDAYLDELTKKMTDFSQRDIEVMVDSAVILAGMDIPDLSKRILSKKHFEKAYEDITREKDKLWDFKEHTTDEERRHRENTTMQERHFKETQEFQLLIAEWHMIYNAIIRDQDLHSPISLNKGIEAINESKKIVFPRKKSVAKIQILKEAGRFTSGKYAAIANTDKEKQESSIQLIPVKAQHESQ